MTMKTSRRGGGTYIYNKGITEMKNMTDVQNRIGVVTLVAGSVVVSYSKISANSRVFVTPQTDSVNSGSVYVIDITAGVGFTVKSTNNLDDRVVAYFVVEA